MAAGAQNPGLIPESLSGVATVGIVTLQTSALGKWFVYMGTLLLGFEFLMTGPTYFFAGRSQEIWPSRAMGIMTFIAASFLDWSVSKLGNRNQVSGVMTFRAGISHPFGGQQMVSARVVWVMAITASTSLERCVHVFVPTG